MIKNFERRHEPLASTDVFVRRMARFLALSVGIILISLGIGILGYHFTEGLSWLDSLLNASMILGGMGPVDQLWTAAGKVFASVFALYSGIVFIVVTGVVFAPVLHRFLHRFHIEEESKKR